MLENKQAISPTTAATATTAAAGEAAGKTGAAGVTAGRRVVGEGGTGLAGEIIDEVGGVEAGGSD